MGMKITSATIPQTGISQKEQIDTLYITKGHREMYLGRLNSLFPSGAILQKVTNTQYILYKGMNKKPTALPGLGILGSCRFCKTSHAL